MSHRLRNIRYLTYDVIEIEIKTTAWTISPGTNQSTIKIHPILGILVVFVVVVVVTVMKLNIPTVGLGTWKLAKDKVG